MRHELIDAEGKDIPSKLAPLIDDFKRSASGVAPERSDLIKGIQERFNFRITLDANDRKWIFEGLRIFELSQIKVSLRSLERLWAYCYGYSTLTTEIQKVGENYHAVLDSNEYKLAVRSLEWASQDTLEAEEGEWPDYLPDPSQKDSSDSVRSANNFFLMTSGRILLHEIAHFELNHNTSLGTDCEVLRREEIEADAWADDWMLGNWQELSDEREVYINRCMAIAFTHAMSLIFGFGRAEPSPNHPSPIDRINSFVNKHIPGGNPGEKRPIDLPLGFLLVIIGYLCWKHQKPFDWEPIPQSYPELFERFRPLFP